MTKRKQIILYFAYVVVSFATMFTIDRTPKGREYLWLVALILIWGSFGVATYTRMLREQAASDGFCRRFGSVEPVRILDFHPARSCASDAARGIIRSATR